MRTARLRRRHTADDLADRVGVSTHTILKLESGDPGVALGTFVATLWMLDLLAPVREAASLEQDRIAGALEALRAPKRARRRRDHDLDRL